MRTWWREHALFVVNVALFIAFVIGMTLTGWNVSNNNAIEHGAATEGLGAYIASGDFWEALFENWESEFLQMGSYVVLTIFLFQKGSSESKPVDKPAPQDEDPRTRASDPRAPWPVRRGGAILVLYENSLLILFAVLFIGAFVGHAIGGAASYSEEQLNHGQPGVTPIQYLGTSQFWFESFQNWQSEFMVIAVLIGAAVYLRQRGSPESKPVATANAENG